MARIVIVGCGCRGQALARELIAEGHAVRGTTRDAARAAAIEALGAEAHVGDPDRIATLTAALDNATVVCWLLASAHGEPASLAALHGTRLATMLERTIDTTVRGVLYETRGSVAPELLAGGARTVEATCEHSQIPYRLLDADPGDHERWLATARAEIAALLR